MTSDNSHDHYDQNTDDYNWLMHHIILRESAQAIGLGSLLMKHLPVHNKSIVDFGCGPGVYLLPFIAKGWYAVGLDGASGAGELLDLASFGLVDLRQAWLFPNPPYFGLSLCIEVAEHLKPEHADTLVQTICENTQQYVFFSAAREGQGGEGHFNCQNRDYWLEKFEQHGFKVSMYHDTIMAEIEENDLYDECKWLRWNGMVLSR